MSRARAPMESDAECMEQSSLITAELSRSSCQLSRECERQHYNCCRRIAVDLTGNSVSFRSVDHTGPEQLDFHVGTDAAGWRWSSEARAHVPVDAGLEHRYHRHGTLSCTRFVPEFRGPSQISSSKCIATFTQALLVLAICYVNNAFESFSPLPQSPWTEYAIVGHMCNG